MHLRAGCRIPFRNRLRTGVVAVLLAAVIGLFAVLVQGALVACGEIASLEVNVRTVIELRETGAFGTGGFGGDRPPGGARPDRARGHPCRRPRPAGAPRDPHA